MGYTITLICGLVLLCLTGYMARRSLNYIKQGHKATATVIGMREVRGRKLNERSTWAPVFKFSTAANQEIVYEYDVSSYPANWTVGETTTVIYDPEKPQKPKLTGYFSLFGWAVVLGAISMAAIWIGGGYYLAKPFIKQL